MQTTCNSRSVYVSSPTQSQHRPIGGTLAGVQPLFFLTTSFKQVPVRDQRITYMRSSRLWSDRILVSHAARCKSARHCQGPTVQPGGLRKMQGAPLAWIASRSRSTSPSLAVATGDHPQARHLPLHRCTGGASCMGEERNVGHGQSPHSSPCAAWARMCHLLRRRP